jgi:quinol-cytochrome oxidoreductase complex cytochrome b subunit
VYTQISVKKLTIYFVVLNVSFHEISAIFGFVVMLTMIFQLISGVMLSFSLVAEPMIVPIVKEEDIKDLYIDDFFWLHKRGADLLFIYSYFYLFRKLYIRAYDYEHEATWKSGVFSFLIFQVVVFFGLALCCTHLSEITLTTAANTMHTFFYGKFYWWLFTDEQLCSDTLIQLTYSHYVTAPYLGYASFIHTIDIHYDWKNETAMGGMIANLTWWDETFISELSLTKDIFIATFCVNWILFSNRKFRLMKILCGVI